MWNRILLTFWASSAHYQLTSTILSISSPKSFYTGLLSIHWCPCHQWYWGLSQYKCSSLHLALLNFVRFAWAPSSSFWGPFGWCRIPHADQLHPSALVSFVNLLRVQLIPLSMSLIKILNSIGPRTGLQRTPVITGFHLDIELLTVIL